MHRLAPVALGAGRWWCGAGRRRFVAAAFAAMTIALSLTLVRGCARNVAFRAFGISGWRDPGLRARSFSGQLHGRAVLEAIATVGDDPLAELQARHHLYRTSALLAASHPAHASHVIGLVAIDEENGIPAFGER